jgi:hypothetical protein
VCNLYETPSAFLLIRRTGFIRVGELPQMYSLFYLIKKYSTNSTNMTTPPHFRDTNAWLHVPDSEIDRLQQTLYPHLRKMKVSYTKAQRIQYVKDLLQHQNNTCAFGKNVGGKYCWNEPKDSDKKYLKLQWGHINPRCRNVEMQSIRELCLLCARCNNQIQTSRYLCQLKAELQSKLDNIDEIINDSR